MPFEVLPLYILVRIIALILAVFGVVAFLKLRKWHLFLSRITILSIALIYTIGLLIPIENLFVQFQTAEEVIEYYKGGTVVAVTQGNESCCGIVLNQGASYNQVIVPKHEDRYKIPYLGMTNTVIKESVPIYATVSHVSGTDDYYILVNMFWNDPVEVVNDSLGYPVQIVNPRPEGYASNSYMFLSYSQGYPENYSLTINGEEVVHFD